MSVTKTIIRLSRHKLYTGNIYYPFGNIISHTHPPYQNTKSAPTEASAQKRKFQLSPNKLYTDMVYDYTLSCTEFAFYQIHYKRL